MGTNYFLRYNTSHFIDAGGMYLDIDGYSFTEKVFS